MTLHDAVRLGICRVREPNWAEKTCYMKIDLIQKERGKNEFAHGPWLHLYSPISQKAIGARTPQDMLCTLVNWDEDGYEVYTGEIAEGDTQNVITIPPPLTDAQISDAVAGRKK